jgi:hypothetical protein
VATLPVTVVTCNFSERGQFKMKRKKQSKSARAKQNRRTRKSRRAASAMKRNAKRTNHTKSRKHLAGRKKRRIKGPTTARQYYALSRREQETWDSVAHVISRMRDGVSLSKASEEFAIQSRIVVELGRSALRIRNGQYVPTKTDRLLRLLIVLSIEGKKEIATRDSDQASLVGGHWAAVQRYLQTGDDSALLRFKGRKVTDASGRRHLLLTDLKELDRQASAGVLSFESIYPSSVR